MSINLDISALAGTDQTGLTSPTFDLAVDVAPDINGKQYAVTALGGTQTGARVHTVSDPFTLTFIRPKSPKALPSVNSITGKYPSVPKNTYGLTVRKGVNIAASQAPQLMVCRLTVDIPAGADAYDAVNVRSALAAMFGALVDQSAEFGDMCVNGIL